MHADDLFCNGCGKLLNHDPNGNGQRIDTDTFGDCTNCTTLRGLNMGFTQQELDRMQIKFVSDRMYSARINSLGGVNSILEEPVWNSFMGSFYSSQQVESMRRERAKLIELLKVARNAINKSHLEPAFYFIHQIRNSVEACADIETEMS